MSEPTAVFCPERRIVGIGVRTTNAEEQDSSTANIPALWEQFHQEGVAERTPNRVEENPWYGVYIQYESDRHGAYRLIAGVEVSSFADVPEGYESVFIPEGAYEVFVAEGEVPQAVLEAWERIWEYYESGHARRRAYTADFERYDPEEPNRVEIYISVV